MIYKLHIVIRLGRVAGRKLCGHRAVLDGQHAVHGAHEGARLVREGAHPLGVLGHLRVLSEQRYGEVKTC